MACQRAIVVCLHSLADYIKDESRTDDCMHFQRPQLVVFKNAEDGEGPFVQVIYRSYLLLLLNGFNAWRVGERWERSSRDTHQQSADQLKYDEFHAYSWPVLLITSST